MPCSCFGKKDKKGGAAGNKEEELYRPRDSRERDPSAPATGPAAAQAKQQPLLAGAPPSTPGTPPATPTTPGGEARLRPEDDPDKATRRRDVVASFYSDQCELIGFKTTGSRPPSAHVGSHPDGPAATSSPATSSPSSTRSAGASCRADLAEKRREFFRDLAAEDEFGRGSRPTSRLTDPGSQQTPRHSHYQEQLHHTLPHNNKTSPRSNKFSATPLSLQQVLQRNSSAEENQPLLHSSSSPDTAPKIILAKPVSEITKLFNSKEASSGSESRHDKVSDKTPLLSDQQTIDTDLEDNTPSIVQSASSEIAPNSTTQSSLETVVSKPESQKLVDISPKEITVTTNGFNQSYEVSLPSNLDEKSDLSSDKSSVVCSQFVNEKVPEEIVVNQNSTCNTKPEVPLVDVCIPQTDLLIDTPMLMPESLQKSIDEHVTVQSPEIATKAQVVLESKDENPIVLAGAPCHVDLEPTETVTHTSDDDHFMINTSKESTPQTLPVIVNETFKESFSTDNLENSPENILQNISSVEAVLDQSPQTIVETTRQFISGSPDEQKSSQTIVETTRQFITGLPEEQTTQTIIETTQNFMSENPDQEKTSQSIVETTRQYISNIPDDIDSQNIFEKAQEILSNDSDGHTVVKTTQHIVSGGPDEQIVQTTVQTTQRIVSENPDEQKNQVIIETTQQSLPASVDSFFLTSVEDSGELPDKFSLQTGTTTTTTTTVITGEPDSFQIQTNEVLEEPRLPEVPCFGVPPPPSSPPPPLPQVEEHVENTFASLNELDAPATPPAAPTATTPVISEESLDSSPLLTNQQEKTEEYPPAPPTPPTPRVDDVPPLLPTSSSPVPIENEQLPPTPPTPPREDDLIPAPIIPTIEKKDGIVTSSGTAATINSDTPAVTCGVEIVSSSSALEDDGLGSEIDDALESIEGISEEGNNNNNIERAAASS